MFCASGLFDEMKRNSLLSAFISPTCLGREVPTLSGPGGAVVMRSFLFSFSFLSRNTHTNPTTLQQCPHFHNRLRLSVWKLKSVENTTCHLSKLMHVSWPAVILFPHWHKFLLQHRGGLGLSWPLYLGKKETKHRHLPKILSEIRRSLTETNNFRHPDQ